jgi:hypothetical protein
VEKRLFDDLPVYVWSELDPSRFAEAFSQTWERVPKEYTQQVLSYWRTNLANPMLRTRMGLTEIRIELLSTWDKHAVDCPGSWAVTHYSGHAMDFYAPVLDSMPEQHLETLIAHELAHVYIEACPQHRHINRQEAAEEVVMELVRIWGFDQDSLNDYKAAYKDGNGAP